MMTNYDRIKNMTAEELADYLKVKDCPTTQLFEIPTPHGRLIDADRLIAVIKSAAGTADTAVPLSAVISSISNAPTIIEKESKQ